MGGTIPFQRQLSRFPGVAWQACNPRCPGLWGTPSKDGDPKASAKPMPSWEAHSWRVSPGGWAAAGLSSLFGHPRRYIPFLPPAFFFLFGFGGLFFSFALRSRWTVEPCLASFTPRLPCTSPRQPLWGLYGLRNHFKKKKKKSV